MFGAIIGDIIGSRFEFNNYRGTDFELFHPDCSFTDDTVCTCAVADWVLNYEGQRPSLRSDFTDLLKSWCLRYPFPAGGYGARFKQWIQNPVPYGSFGNGAAMRISPVGFMYDELAEMNRVTFEVTAVSHDHPEGIKGARAVALAILLARRGNSKATIKETIELEFDYDLNFTCDEIRPFNSFNETCQVTVPQALVCFLESSNFESAIRLAISIGGDSDTIAAITGSVAEAYYGIPAWIKEKALEYLTPEMSILVSKFYKKINHDRI